MECPEVTEIISSLPPIDLSNAERNLIGMSMVQLEEPLSLTVTADGDAHLGLWRPHYPNQCKVPTWSTRSEMKLRGAFAPQINKFTVDNRTKCSSGAKDKPPPQITVVIPRMAGTFGELIYGLIYPAYAAIHRAAQLAGGTAKDVRVVLLGKKRGGHELARAEGEGTEDAEGAVGRRLNECPSFPGHSPAMFRGDDGRVGSDASLRGKMSARNGSTMLSLEDGTKYEVDFDVVTRPGPHCKPPPKGAKRNKGPNDLLAQYARAWVGHKNVLVEAQSRASEYRVCLQGAPVYMLIPKMNGGPFLSEGMRASPLFSAMIQDVKRFYLKQEPRVRRPRDDIVLMTRDCIWKGESSCCTCGRLWLNAAEVAATLRKLWPGTTVHEFEGTFFDLNQTVKLLDRARVMIGLHGSAMWNMMFLRHCVQYTSVAIEIFPAGYFEQDMPNLAAHSDVTYLKAAALNGNFRGHSAWTVTPMSQVDRLLKLGMDMTENTRLWVTEGLDPSGQRLKPGASSSFAARLEELRKFEVLAHRCAGLEQHEPACATLEQQALSVGAAGTLRAIRSSRNAWASGKLLLSQAGRIAASQAVAEKLREHLMSKRMQRKSTVEYTAGS